MDTPNNPTQNKKETTMKIITLSREFGSGGRELGKRLAEEMGFTYYDREIIAAIAKESGKNENYVANTLDHAFVKAFPFTFKNSFAANAANFSSSTELLVAQKK